MTIQKIYKNGNSLVVAIPKQYLEELNLSEGSQITLDKQKDGLLLSAKKQSLANEINPEFAERVQNFIKNHRAVLEELAKR